MLALIKLNLEIIVVIASCIVGFLYFNDRKTKVDEPFTPVVMTVGIIDNPDGSARIVQVPVGCLDFALHVIPICEKSAIALPQDWTD